MLAIDNSFSMRQGDRLARAKRKPPQAASKSARRQTSCKCWPSARRCSVMGDSAAGRSSTIEPTDTRSSYAELSRALRSIAQSARMPVEAHLFSDMQKSSLPANFADLRLGEGVKLFAHPVADRACG